MTNVEAFLKTLISFKTTKSGGGSKLTTPQFLSIATIPQEAKVVYISNTTGQVLQVQIGGIAGSGGDIFEIPTNTIFPFYNIINLSNVFVKAKDGSVGLTVSFRYEF